MHSDQVNRKKDLSFCVSRIMSMCVCLCHTLLNAGVLLGISNIIGKP